MTQWNSQAPDTREHDDATRPAKNGATVRLTVSVDFDLQGESPELAADLLQRMVEHALQAHTRSAQGSVQVLTHVVESCAVVASHSDAGSDTNFSQLLDF